MNLVILIDSPQMFFRNFGFRHATAALGEFALGLAGGPRRRAETAGGESVLFPDDIDSYDSR